MKNLYNKGKYRGYEYGKIPKSMKRHGNKLWRHNQDSIINELLFDNQLIQNSGSRYRKKLSKKILLKITLKSYRNRKVSYYKKYKLERDVHDTLKRLHVLQATFLNRVDPSKNVIIQKNKQ